MRTWVTGFAISAHSIREMGTRAEELFNCENWTTNSGKCQMHSLVVGDHRAKSRLSSCLPSDASRELLLGRTPVGQIDLHVHHPIATHRPGDTRRVVP